MYKNEFQDQLQEKYIEKREILAFFPNKTISMIQEGLKAEVLFIQHC